MKVCILSQGGGGGDQTPNLNFLDLILVQLLNLVKKKIKPIFGLNFRGEEVCLKKFRQNTYFDFCVCIFNIESVYILHKEHIITVFIPISPPHVKLQNTFQWVEQLHDE